MKVTIDTKVDSKEEIQKAVEFLQTLMQMKNTGISSSQTNENFAAIFNSTEQPKEQIGTDTTATEHAAKPKSEIPKVEIFDVDDLFEDEK